MNGKLIIFSAPSGSGKTTIVRELLATNSNLGFSISACTRPPRGDHEKHGIDYYFLSVEDFRQRIANNEFAEWEEVYPGTYYGTLKSEIERLWSLGKHVLFDVDVKGGLALKRAYQDKALAVFVRVPSVEVLEQRLRSRGTETEESLAKRIAKMTYELSFEQQFDVVLINDSLETAMSGAQRLVDEFIN